MKPILFNTAMVQAILSGRKTVTRRAIKTQPKMRLSYISGGHGAGKWGYPSSEAYKYWGDEWRIPEGLILDEEDKTKLWTPPCHTDDVLYVRETWAPLYPNESSNAAVGYLFKADRMGVFGDEYKEQYDAQYPDGKDYMWEDLWRPSIHMPRDAARLFLKVKNVAVEKLQDITQEEVRREGFVDDCCMCSFNNGYGKGEINCSKGISKITECSLHQMFPDIPGDFPEAWGRTLKKSERNVYGWDANPYVWRIEFERISREEAGR